MIEGEDENGPYREYIVKFDKEKGCLVEVDHESDEGKEFLKKQLMINLSRQRRKKK